MTSAIVAKRCRRKPLAVCIAALFALSANDALPAPPPVTNCLDSGSGSMRAAITDTVNTPSNSTINLSGLGCSTITLTTGSIVVSQHALTIKGPVSHIAITAKNSPVKDRIFSHAGSGSGANFNLSYLDIQYGRAYDNSTAGVNGGCIESAGNVIIADSSVTHCSANSLHGRAYGGGIAASGVVLLTRSMVSGNYTTSLTAYTKGGGVYSHGEVLAKYSTISDNFAGSSPGSGGNGGGIASAGGASLTESTISGNGARNNAGGLSLRTETLGTLPSATITNSTISDNHTVSGVAGGVYANIPISVFNSTIAFNQAGSGTQASGLAIRAQYASITATLNSVLVSNNSYGAVPSESDFSASAANPYTIGVSGANNLIVTSSGPVPASGLITACALLGPLRDNGGRTQTHQLFSHSPAIDAGNNVTTTALTYDQRDSPFGRASGGFADIGAYEVQQADIVFNAGFEGCP